MRQRWAAAGGVVLLLTQLTCSSGLGPRTPGYYEYTITTNGRARTITGSDAAFWTYYPCAGQPTNLGVYFYIGAITGLQIELTNASPTSGTYGGNDGGTDTTVVTSVIGDSIPPDLNINGAASTMTISSVDFDRIAGSFTIMLGGPPDSISVVIQGRFNAARTSTFRPKPI
jgi:hypothetical protein